MKKILLCTVLLLGLMGHNLAEAQDRTFGLGGMIGGPDGISAKLWVSENKAITGGLSFALADEISWLQIQADFLVHKPLDFNWEGGLLQFYYGAGLGYYSGTVWDEIYIRVPGGLAFDFSDAPFDMFLEVVPFIDIDPAFYFSFTGAVGFRYYFGN